jgi:hypothetical protein
VGKETTMSEEALKKIIERANKDQAFKKKLEEDPLAAVKDLGLSPAEETAIATGDEDALRRLVGADVQGFWILVTVACATRVNCPNTRPPACPETPPRPGGTPGSCSGCGTGRCAGQIR